MWDSDWCRSFLGHIHSKSILDLYAGLVIVDINKKTREII